MALWLSRNLSCSVFTWVFVLPYQRKRGDRTTNTLISGAYTNAHVHLIKKTALLRATLLLFSSDPSAQRCMARTRSCKAVARMHARMSGGQGPTNLVGAKCS